VGVLRDLRLPQVQKKKILPEFGRDPVARGGSGRRAPGSFAGDVELFCEM